MRRHRSADWNRQIILVARRSGLSDLSRRFNVAWLLSAVHEYHRMVVTVAAERDRIARNLRQARLDVAGLRALREDLAAAVGLDSSRPPADAPAQKIRDERLGKVALLIQQIASKQSAASDGSQAEGVAADPAGRCKWREHYEVYRMPKLAEHRRRPNPNARCRLPCGHAKAALARCQRPCTL